MKKFLQIIVFSILVLILFRGTIYRFFIEYTEIGKREKLEITDEKLIQKIKNKSANRQLNLKSIVNIASEITREELSFTTNRISNNPNVLINLKQANCVGYSAMFNSIANYLISKNELQDEIEAEHKIAQLSILGINLHQFFDSPFFADHDFNEVKNIKTNELISIDPSVNDYLRINRINKRITN